MRLRTLLKRSGFTLLELLIVIGVVAVLATITLLVLNPAEMLKQGRDAKRISEIASINDALNLAVAQNPNTSLGTEKTLYISLPDANPECASWSAYLPPLLASTGWEYQCVTLDNLRKNNGTGWLPVNFSGLPTSPFSNLPVDPVNAAQQGLFYSYAVIGGKWEINADMESSKYKWGGQRDVEGTDSGNTIVLYEKGADLNVMPKEANWRIGYVYSYPESCFSNYAPESWGDQQEYYPRWMMSGSGRVAVVKIAFWDVHGTLDSGETILTAVYNDGVPDYAKISENVALDGLGQIGWISSTLSIPIALNLSRNYVFGSVLADASFVFRIPYDNAPISSTCLPTGNGGYYYSPADQKLNPTVPTGLTNSARQGFFGIIYSY